MTQVVEATRRDAWHVLGIEHPHTPKLLSRVEKLAYAKQLRDEAGWPLWAIGETFGVHESVVSRWLHGDPQRWREVAGRGRSTKPKRRARAAVAVEAPPAEAWPDDEPEPGGPWDEPEPVDEPEPAPSRARAKPGTAQPFGALSDVVAARAAAAGLPLTPAGTVDWAAMADGPAQDGPQVAPVPVVPPAPPLWPAAPTAATRRPQPPPAIPARAVDAEVVASCGHALYVPPAKAARGAAIVCTRCGQRAQVQRLTGRYSLG